jgi:hypothetical protein
MNLRNRMILAMWGVLEIGTIVLVLIWMLITRKPFNPLAIVVTSPMGLLLSYVIVRVIESDLS